MAKDVLGLEISMKKTIFVEIRQACGDFKENRSNLVLSEGPIALLGSGINLVQVAVKIVEDHVQLRICKNNLL